MERFDWILNRLWYCQFNLLRCWAASRVLGKSLPIVDLANLARSNHPTVENDTIAIGTHSRFVEYEQKGCDSQKELRMCGRIRRLSLPSNIRPESIAKNADSYCLFLSFPTSPAKVA